MKRVSTQIWRDWRSLYGATVTAQVVAAARSIAVAAVLGPRQLGLWKSLQIVVSYSIWSDLGGRRGMGRQVPLLRGAGDDSGAGDMRAAAWTLTALPVLAICGALLVAAAVVPDRQLRGPLAALAAVLLSTRGLLYLLELCNAEKLFTARSGAVLALALLDGALAPLAAWWGGLVAFMLAVAAANAAVFLYLKYRLKVGWGLRWRPADLEAVIAVGMPLAAAGFAYELLQSVDRFVIVVVLGAREVGYYALAIIVFELAAAIPAVLAHVLLPNVLERFARGGDRLQAFADAERGLHEMGRLLPLLLAAGWLLLPAATLRILPAYQPGIEAARLLLWSGVFVSVHVISSVVLITLRRMGILMAIDAAAALLAAGLCGAVLLAGSGITGVAAVMLAVYGLAGGAAFIAAGRLCGRSAVSLAASLAVALTPAAAAAAIAAAVGGVG